MKFDGLLMKNRLPLIHKSQSIDYTRFFDGILITISKP
jgi:hypothetical protein